MPTSLPRAPDAPADGTAQDPVYAYKPSLLAAPFQFRLGADALYWEKGRITGRTPYDGFKRIRMSFRPMTMQGYRFVTEIWPVEGPKLQAASTSAKGIVEQERFDAPYRAFVVELHRRIHAAGGTPRLEAGSNPFLYWPGVLVFGGGGIAITGLALRALTQGAWSGALFITAFLALFGWQAWGFFRRNIPCTYRADAVPEVLLPREKK